MKALLTYMNIHEGTNVSWGHYLVYVTWRDFNQWHARISRWVITKTVRNNQLAHSARMMCNYQVIQIDHMLIIGCEYGDRAQWCSTYTDLDCSVDHQLKQCCRTCALRTGQASDDTSGGGSCPNGDGANFCKTMPAKDCYHFSNLCCETCPTHYTGIDGNVMCILCFILYLNNLLQLTQQAFFWPGLSFKH